MQRVRQDKRAISKVLKLLKAPIILHPLNSLLPSIRPLLKILGDKSKLCLPKLKLKLRLAL